MAIYDGLRHLLFLQPLVALASATGLVAAWKALIERPRSRTVRGLALLSLGLLASLPISSILRLRPYEYVYFNHLSGGLPAADGRFELDYWGLSYREGVDWLAQTQTGDDRVAFASCSHPGSVSWFVRPPLEYVGSLLFEVTEPTRFLIHTTPHDCVWDPPWDPPPGEVLHTVERYGVPLLTVVRLDQSIVESPNSEAALTP